MTALYNCAICVSGEAQTGLLFHLTGSGSWWEQCSCHQPDCTAWSQASGRVPRQLLRLNPPSCSLYTPCPLFLGPAKLGPITSDCSLPRPRRAKGRDKPAFLLGECETLSNFAPTARDTGQQGSYSQEDQKPDLGWTQPCQPEFQSLSFRKQAAGQLH